MRGESSAPKVSVEGAGAAVDGAERAATRPAYAVEWGHEFPAEIDSLWTTEEEAKKRADELGGDWGVSKWSIQAEWSPEKDTASESDRPW